MKIEVCYKKELLAQLRKKESKTKKKKNKIINKNF